MKLLIAAALLAAGPMATHAQAQTTASAPAPDVYAERLLDALKHGKVNDGLAGIVATSPLLKDKIGPSSSMATQLQSMLDIYGPITGWERVSSQNLGTMLRRDTYLVQHRDAVIRWRFVYTRVGTGWTVGQFAFEDNAAAWFD